MPRALEGSDLDTFSAMVRLKKVRGGTTLFSTRDALSAVYVVRSGTFKAVTVSHSGQEKITAFYLPGDFMGLDAINDGAHSFDAVVLEDGDVCVLPIHRLESMAGAVPALQKQFVRALSAELARDHTVLLLGSMDAEHRIARLLISLAHRYHQLGYASDGLLLHMTRDEIASYLCLSSETVSRVLSRMQRRGALIVHQRQIAFADPAQLAEISAW